MSASLLPLAISLLVGAPAHAGDEVSAALGSGSPEVSARSSGSARGDRSASRGSSASKRSSGSRDSRGGGSDRGGDRDSRGSSDRDRDSRGSSDRGGDSRGGDRDSRGGERDARDSRGSDAGDRDRDSRGSEARDRDVRERDARPTSAARDMSRDARDGRQTTYTRRITAGNGPRAAGEDSRGSERRVSSAPSNFRSSHASARAASNSRDASRDAQYGRHGQTEGRVSRAHATAASHHRAATAHRSRSATARHHASWSARHRRAWYRPSGWFRPWHAHRPVSWYHGVFVYGPYPWHHHDHVVVVDGDGGGRSRDEARDSGPKRAVDRAGSFSIGVRGGSYLGGYDTGDAYGDAGLGLAARYRPVEAVGLELAWQYHDQTWEQTTERINQPLQASVQLFAAPWSRVNPYVLAGVTFNDRNVQDDVGPFFVDEDQALWGPHGGLGLELNVGKKASVNGDVRYVGYLNVPEDDITRPGAFTANLGLNFYF